MFALLLLDAIDGGVIPRQDVDQPLRSAKSRRYRRQASQRAVGEGVGYDPPASAKGRLKPISSRVTFLRMIQAGQSFAGRAVFAKNSASCHRLFDEGSRIGPDLTGGQRRNLDYVLDNVLDPGRPWCRATTRLTFFG